MKTLKKESILPVYVEFIPEILDQGTIYISRRFKTSTHLCLCGCGNKTILPFGPNWWQLYENEKGISITPSIGNYAFPCQSHYIITNNIANFV